MISQRRSTTSRRAPRAAPGGAAAATPRSPAPPAHTRRRTDHAWGPASVCGDGARGVSSSCTALGPVAGRPTTGLHGVLIVELGDMFVKCSDVRLQAAYEEAVTVCRQ